MARMKCGVAAVEALRAAGVTRLFGLMGSSTLELYDALYDRRDMQYVGVRHENCGVHMADAYGRVTQTPGLFICGQAGPGTANMVLGLAQAKLAYSPVVVVAGMPATTHLGRDTFQEIDQHAMLTPVTKRVLTVPRADRIPEFLLEAFRIAGSGRRGPVVVQIPRDLFNGEIEAEIPARGRLPEVCAGTVDGAMLERVKVLVLEARAPVIHAGAGIKWGRASGKLVALAEKLQLPVTNSAGHGDVLPVDHPLYFGGAGPRGNPVATALLREADLVLALGTRLGFNTTRFSPDALSPAAQVVQVDVDPIALGRYYPAAIAIAADAGAVCAALAAIVEPIAPERAPWKVRNERALAQREALLRERAEKGSRVSRPLLPDAIFAELRKAAPRDALFTLDAGTTCLQATDQLPYHTVPACLTPLDCGMVGFSYAAGLGAKVAAPERTVISLAGDGAFGMTMGEMATAVMHGINTIAIVMDNGTWGSEIAYQRDFYNRRYIGAHVLSPRFDEVMKLCGGAGYYAEEAGEVADALREALRADRPAVIHVKVDPEAVFAFRTDALGPRA